MSPAHFEAINPYGTLTFDVAGASSVQVIRYRYRGAKIATPWEPKTAALIG